MTLKRILLAGVAVLGAGAVGLVASNARESASPTIRPVTDGRMEAADTSGEWLTYGRDYQNRRFVPFTQISRQNVRGLTEIWHQGALRLTLLRSYLRNESTPVVADGVVIYTDPGNRLAQPGNHVIAVDARTGRQLWAWYHKTGAVALCCGLVNRGVALYGDKVYVATLDAHLIALDRRTGEVLWDRTVENADPSDGYSFTMAPLAADGKIIIGASGGEFRIRGFVDAYDPESGRRLWRFHTVPSPEEGSWWGELAMTTPEGDRLPRDTAEERRDSAAYAEEWKFGGGPVWTTPAYDPEQRLLILGIGNPSRVEGRTAPGDNRYTTSIAALDVGTGKLRWYYQMVPHDQGDHDPASPPLLIDVPHQGAMVPAVAEAGKTGYVYILDRRTGKLLRRSEPFVPVENPFPTPTALGVRTSPGTHGGASWPSAAYSPQTRAMYVVGSHFPMLYRIDSAAGAAADRRVGRSGHVFGAFSKLEGDGRYGVLSAVDVATGKIRWEHRAKGPLMFGGVLATAGGLVFFPEGGWLKALDAETGALLWRHQMDRGTLGPVISFMMDGKQRLAVASARGLTVFGLP